MMAVRKDCGLKRPLSQVTAGGSWGLPTQSVSCVSLACRERGQKMFSSVGGRVVSRKRHDHVLLVYGGRE